MGEKLYITFIVVCALAACSTVPDKQSSIQPEEVPIATDIALAELDLVEISMDEIPTPIHIITEPPELAQANPIIDPDQPVTADNDLWEKIRNNLQLTRHLDNRAVKERIAWYARNQEYLDRVTKRATPYLYYVVQELDKRDMPLDLALLPVVESAYHPFAYSRSRASGIWQFIPSTGRMYGLKQNWWYDGRRDIVAATRAALDYLQKLNKQFDGDWEHALAAYNSGEMNVAKSIKRNKASKKNIDFFSLRLPRETRGYVPSLLAVAEIVADPKKYGINLNPIPNQSYFEKVDIGGQLDLSTAANLTGLSIDELYTLNPGFNRWATDPDGPHYLLVPGQTKQKFIEGLNAIPPEERVGWSQHLIKSGESLSEIADKYKTNINIIKETNNLRSNLIRAGHSLLIPTSKQPGKFYTMSLENRWLGDLKREGSGNKYIYTVRNGDSLWTIGRRYNASISQISSWNGINSRNYLRPGQKLTLWISSPGEPAKKVATNTTASNLNYSRNEDGHINYIVTNGDSLWLISRQFGVTISQLQQWNKIPNGKYLQPGQKLVLLSAPALTTGV